MEKQIFAVTLRGITPYMQHRMDDKKLEDWERSRGKIIERIGLNDEDEKVAAFHSFIDDEGQFYMPSDHLRMALINAGAFIKSKVGNARKSMKNIVAAMFDVNPERIIIPKFDSVDKRSAVNKNVKARIITKRPKWNEDWEVSFKLIVDDNSITKETVVDLLNYAGRYIGIGSYRPQNNGKFGRFEIENIQKN